MPSSSFDTPKRELLVFYYKYRRRLLLAFLLPFLLAIAVSFVPTPRYASTATLIVRLGSEYVYQPEIGAGSNGPASPIPFERDQIYKAEVAILESHDLHQQVVETIGLDRMYPQKDAATAKPLTPLRDWLLDKVDARYPREEENPAWVEHLRTYLDDYDLETRLSDEEKARHRLDVAVEKFGKRLGILLGKESAVITLSFEHKDRAVAVEALDVLLKLYMEKRKHLYLETRGSLASTEAETARRRASAAQAAVENFKREHQLYSLADQRTQLLAQREDVRKQMMTVSNPALEDKMRAITTQLDDLDAQERQFNALTHEVQVTNDEYTLYVHKRDEAQTYDNLERARVGSVLVAQPPAAPPEPKKLQILILAAGFILSLIFTVIVAALTEFSRSGFLTPERLERNIGLPVLGVLSLRK